MKVFIARIYQKILYIFTCLIKFREPIILKKLDEAVEVLRKHNKKNILLLSGKRVCKEEFYIYLDNLLKEQFNVLNYTDIPSDPDIESIEKAVIKSKEYNVDAIISIGGGSTMDAGKIVAARLTNNKSIRKMRGLLKITKKPIFMIAVPTTCGTGSECTVASVVTDLERNEKYAINDPKLIPQYAVLDPKTLLTLPKHLIATTALDALTHAIEAYIGKSNTNKTRRYAHEAIYLIFDNVEEAYKSHDLESLELLQLASYDAGIAFTKAYVGYVHAFSHAISAYYHLPHGYLNGVLLPIILEEYGDCINKELQDLNVEVFNNTDNPHDFIDKLKELLVNLDIKNNLCDIIKDEDIPNMIKHIKKEVYPLYPVPRYFSDEELLNIFNKIRNIA
ncbi:MAG: iron-containing alcohol dehydrogenase [Bacilli bacterium]|nr:iron-containing alcohol dehydrogenase [Bacilli bacterium]